MPPAFGFRTFISASTLRVALRWLTKPTFGPMSAGNRTAFGVSRLSDRFYVLSIKPGGRFIKVARRSAADSAAEGRGTLAPAPPPGGEKEGQKATEKGARG